MTTVLTTRNTFANISIVAIVAGVVATHANFLPFLAHSDTKTRPSPISYRLTFDVALPVYTIPNNIGIYSSTEYRESVARTELGRRLLEYRKKVIAKGVVLWSGDEINLEVKRLRGETS